MDLITCIFKVILMPFLQTQSKHLASSFRQLRSVILSDAFHENVEASKS